MTKFEEEVTRPDNTGIDPFSKRDVDFSKIAEKFTRGAQTLKSWRNYADYKEHQLEQKDEQIQSLAKMVDKLNGQNVDLKGELEEVRDLQGEANNQAAKEYIDRCEAESKLKELKSQLQQQALPVVPDFIGKLINTFGAPEDGKHINYSASYLENQKELDWIDNHQKTWLTALLIGFTVEKPQLFYLENKITGMYLSSDGK
jgi:DNA repair exonuclease SbcCD ATPase subunit